METLNGLDIGINIDVRKVCALLYADDVVLVSESPCDLQKLLDALYNWCCKWKLRVNYEKSKIIHFRKKREKIQILNTHFV